MVIQADVPQLQTALAAGAVVLDVREAFEFASGHVPGAVSMPMHLVPLRLDEIPQERDLYVICAAGNRSWQVAHFLGERGINVINVVGGTMAWHSAGLPIETGSLPSQAVSGGTHA